MTKMQKNHEEKMKNAQFDHTLLHRTGRQLSDDASGEKGKGH